MAKPSSINAKEVKRNARAKRSIEIGRPWRIVTGNVDDGERVAADQQQAQVNCERSHLNCRLSEKDHRVKGQAQPGHFIEKCDMLVTRIGKPSAKL